MLPIQQSEMRSLVSFVQVISTGMWSEINLTIVPSIKHDFLLFGRVTSSSAGPEGRPKSESSPMVDM
jgi:hypothetical protein